MFSHTRAALMVVAAAFFLLVAVAAHAQRVNPPSQNPDILPQPTTPTVLSGADFGFRIERMKGDTPVGTLVVRRNGQWVPVEMASGLRQLSLR